MTDTSNIPPSGQPSRNPTNDGRLLGVLRVFMKKFLQGKIDDMLPAMVTDYSRTTNMASVQPLISVVTTLNTIQVRAQVASVPVLQLGGGGFTLNFPVKKGDMGFIKSNDRDISFFKQFWKLTTPASGRMHSFEDSIFIPAALTGVTIAGSDTINTVLQSLDGTTRLSMGTGNFCMTDTVGYAQSVNAILDLQSTTRAFKFPAMSAVQKNAIPSPKAGFAVYDTTAGGVSIYNGSVWS